MKKSSATRQESVVLDSPEKGENHQVLEVPPGGSVEIALSAAPEVAGLGGHLSPDPEALGGEGWAPELFFSSGTLESPEEGLVLHVLSASERATGSRHRYRVDFGPCRDLVELKVRVTSFDLQVDWVRASRNASGGRQCYPFRTRLPVGGTTGFFGESSGVLHLCRDGLLTPQPERDGTGYGSLEAVVVGGMGGTGGGEGEEEAYTGGGGNSGSGGIAP